MTPEQCGISSARLEAMLRKLDDYGFAMHSMLMSRKGEPFLEAYWAPFHAGTLHRQNSVTKSFVGLAILLLELDGKLKLTDKLHTFFADKLPEDLQDELKALTLYDLMTMQTSHLGTPGHWVRDGVKDRISKYFETPQNHPAGTMFWYDSAGSFLLGVIVERLIGKPFMEYLKERVLSDIGFSPDAACIQGPDGYSWSDSGLLCTTQDLHRTALLLMNGGKWQGKQLFPAALAEMLTKQHTANTSEGFRNYNCHGYGMQVWRTFENGFAFIGMGDQLVICIPEKEFIFVCTADNQGNPAARHVLFDNLYYNIIKELSDTPLPEDTAAHQSLTDYVSRLTLTHLEGNASTAYTEKVNGSCYILKDNPMGIKDIQLTFADGEGTLTYHNAQGKKVLPFGINQNAFCDFPEEGYFDMQVVDFCPGNYYPCAVSGTWIDENKFMIKVQMIGKHLGGVTMTFGFAGEQVGVRMIKNTNCFLRTYDGCTTGYKKSI